MKILSICVLLFLPFFALAVPSFSDTSQVMKRYDYNSGLSQVSVTALAQDQFGYIWIGTQAGLNRFDGHEFKQFSSQQQSKQSLAGGFITVLCHENDKLWIGTSTGLSVYFSEKGTFQTFLAADYDAIDSDRVSYIDCKTDYIIVSTETGHAYRIHADNLTPETMVVSEQNIRYTVKSEANYFYLNEQGLIQYSETTSSTQTLVEGHFKLIELSGQRVYIADYANTLIAYDLNSRQTLWQKKLLPAEGAVVNDIKITADQITLATGNGVYILDLKGQILRHWVKSENVQHGLQDNSILSVMNDIDGDLWIGTESRGLHFISKLSDSFGHVGEFNYPKNPIGNPDVRSFAFDSEGTLWIATSDGPKMFNGYGFVKPAQIYPEMLVLENVFVTKLLVESNKLWLTTRGSGVYRLDLTTSKLDNWRTMIDGTVELSFNDITLFNDEILVSSRSTGLHRFNPIEQGFEAFLDQESSNVPTHVSSLLVDSRDLLFGSIGNGLFRYKDGTLTQLTTADGLASNIVFMIEKDSKGKVWVASEAGLSIVNQDFTVERTIKQTNGLANDAIWSIVFDGRSHLWVGTSGGLSQIDINDYVIYNFLPVDGVQDHEFNYNAAWLAPDGRVFMGGAKGFNQFYPENITIKQYQRALIISEIAVLGTSLLPEKNGMLDKAAELSKKIELEHDQNIISLHYSSLEFSSDRQLKYFYRVLGLSDKWLRLANGTRQVNLLKLEPGNYTVEVYTVNRFNQHSPIHSFAIKVKAPLWWNTWSKLAYSFLVIGLVFYVVRLKQRRYKKVVEDNRIMTELRDRLELSLWASGDELWDWHLKTKKIYRYRVTPRIDYGASVEDLELEDMNRYVHPKDCIALEDKIEACIRGDQESYEVPLRVKDLSGNWVWVLDRGKVVSREKNGIATRIAGALKDITELKSHQDALQKLNEQLEIKVAMRTDELYKKNQKLEQAMMELKRTQQELIESERMASLGNLVAGVAHEINTPLGVAITALTYNMECLKTVEQKLISKSLKQQDLEKSISEQDSGYALIMRNLDRAQTLIGNFKQVAVDQSSETERVVNIKSYIRDVFDSLTPITKGKGIDIVLSGDEKADILTYPGAIYQIITNLLNNSVIHGFENRTTGVIKTDVVVSNNTVLLIYSDNGNGVKPEIITNIFDPFVTSKRNQGGCGLGMHIVYNLVTQLLKGEIKCLSEEGKGVQFVIKFPVGKVERDAVA